MIKVDPNKDGGPSVLSSLALVGQLGLVVAVPIVLGVFVGNYLDNLAGAHGLVLIGMVLLGIVAAVYSAYRIVAQAINWKS
jgi:F0F1-type ATP synthase assembly protein I